MNTVTVKKISLGAAGFLAALVFGYFFKAFIGTPNTAHAVIIFIVSVLFLAIFLLQTILGSDKWISPVCIILEATGISVFFFGNMSVVLLAGIASMIGMLLIAHYHGVAEIGNNLDIHFSKTSRIIMAFATMAIALFASFAYVGSFDIHNPVAAKKNLEVIIKPFEPLLAGYIPNFSSRNTLKDIAAAALPADFKLSSPDQKAQAVAQISARLADTLTGFVGTPVSANDRVIDIVYKGTLGRVVGLSPLAQNGLMVVFGLIFFFMIKFILFFVDWAAVFAGSGLYKVLQVAGFFKIEVQNVPKRVIVLE